MARRKINWNNKKVISILKSNDYNLSQMAEMIGVSKWLVCRKRKSLGITQRLYGEGRTSPLTNQERKARYNAKRKAIGWKYLYQVSKQ